MTNYWRNFLQGIKPTSYFLICLTTLLLKPLGGKEPPGGFVLQKGGLNKLNPPPGEPQWLRQSLDQFQKILKIPPYSSKGEGFEVKGGENFAFFMGDLKWFSLELKRAENMKTPLLVSDSVQNTPLGVGGVNGTFFSPEAILGPLIIHGVPEGHYLGEKSSKRSRCFFYLENGSENKPDRIWFDEGVGDSKSLLKKLEKKGVHPNFLLGGGGWVVKKGRPVEPRHLKNQGFTDYFSQVRLAPRTLIGCDPSGTKFYLITFKGGLTLIQMANQIQKEPELKNLYQCIFMDGGGSTLFYYGGDYLQRPLYFLERPNFTSIVIVRRNPHGTR